MASLVAFSDSHLNFPKISDSKYLICAGDYESGYNDFEKSVEITETFFSWFGRQKAQYKIFVPGNHDTLFWLDKDKFKSILENNKIILLDDEIKNIGGLRVFGSPYFYSCRLNRFLYVNFPDPNEFDLMVTHVPPKNVMDFNPKTKNNIGSEDLRDYVQNNKIKCHIFGHCHEGHCHASPFFNVAVTGRGKAKSLVNEPLKMGIDHLI